MSENQPASAPPAARPPGVVISWHETLKDWPPVVSNPDLVRRIWEENDALAHMYIWQLLLSF